MTLRLTIFNQPLTDDDDNDDFANLENLVNTWLKTHQITREQLVKFRMGTAGYDLLVCLLIDEPNKEGVSPATAYYQRIAQLETAKVPSLNLDRFF